MLRRSPSSRNPPRTLCWHHRRHVSKKPPADNRSGNPQTVGAEDEIHALKMRLTENEALDRGMNEGGGENVQNIRPLLRRTGIIRGESGFKGAELLPVRVVLVRGACRADPGLPVGGSVLAAAATSGPRRETRPLI
ncbi:hypothetical protein CPLU01_03372 [Colletotrichum plurivorum]|uniref:Uncharacterized protein n=1 Tax=Colletotrichum plurivorum TaxID=2175906 RepID=A0A8H6KTS6_9PEZI|nr:hypothetical protein CPLU01_03372 [Colletotrichum plurivorum]